MANMMRVSIEILTGTLFHIVIKADAVVRELKDAIGDQEGLPKDRLILVAGPIMTDDHVALKDYGVKDGSHLYLYFTSIDNHEADCGCEDYLWCQSFEKMAEKMSKDEE